MSQLKTGKIDPAFLAGLLARYTRAGGRVAIGAGIGEDAAAIHMGGAYLLAKTDPITHASDRIGQYAVHINANDIAAMGGTPLWFLATLLMPEGSTERQLEDIFSQISITCESLGISYCGGHTEVTTSVTSPVVVGQMLGEVSDGGLKPTSGAKKGDLLMMTKCAAIEATAIIALERGEELSGKVPEALLARARNYLAEPGISVVADAMALGGMDGLHAFHDPTEGGVATGISEIAEASGLGVMVHSDAIAISEETRLLCDLMGVDPLGTFASGALLMTVDPKAAEEVALRLQKHSIPVCTVGRMTSSAEGRWLVTEGRREPLPVFHQDELSGIFG